MSEPMIVTHRPSETTALGRCLGELAEPGDLLLLQGDLGAGKTLLTQGIAAGLTVAAVPSSPTFTLVNEYTGRLPLFHIDLYRLSDVADVLTLGLEEYLEAGGVTVVEWPERGSPLWPADHLLIEIEYVDDQTRRLRFRPSGDRYRALVAALLGRWGHVSPARTGR